MPRKHIDNITFKVLTILIHSHMSQPSSEKEVKFLNDSLKCYGYNFT